ncbi:MAG: hypothetical protein JWQ35_89 [Bacteriovoracaceae bacterium]|nr:hypothetical protein [Bacteriovoracaceae bacterium]
MKSKPQILFVVDQWCEGQIANGISEWETNLWKSLESTGLADIETFHFDDYFLKHKVRADEALIQKCLEKKPDLIVLGIYTLPGSATQTLTFETLKQITNQKIPIVATWGDLHSPIQSDIADKISAYTKLNIYTASSEAASRVSRPELFTYTWVPKDERLFRDLKIERDIPFIYLGSSKPDRAAAVDYLNTHGVHVAHTGGERECHVSTADYASLLNRAQISLSFSRSGGFHVTNARVFETMLCGAMLLEQEGAETARLYEPFKDYVPFSDHKDLLEKAKFYIANPDVAKKIAESGYKKTCSQYSALKFWQMILKRVFD